MRSTEPRKATEPLAGDGIALVRHGAGTLLAIRKELLGFEDLRALQVAEFRPPTFNARGDERECSDEFGVEVALDDLRGDGCWSKAELLADEGLYFRGEMRAGAHGAGELADRHRRLRCLQPLQRAAKLIVHQRHLETERRRLGVDAMAAADHGGEAVLARLGRDDFSQGLDVGNEDVGRLRHLDGKGGVPDVAAGEAEVQPAAGGRADVFGDVGGERDDVVVECAFEFLATIHGKRRPGFHPRKILFWHQSLSGEGFGGEQFDLEPDFQLALFAPDFPHLRP
jgi:hypothetical protein